MADGVNVGVVGTKGIFGNEVIGDGSLYSGHIGVLGILNPPRGGNFRPERGGKPGKVGAKSFRAATATFMLESDKTMKKAKTKIRLEDAITM